MKRDLLVVVLGLLTMAGGLLAGEPKLENEKVLLSGNQSFWARRGGGLGAMQLSPDGKWLLYIHAETTSPTSVQPKGRTTGKLVLRDVASAKDVILPMPAFGDCESAAAAIRCPVFDSAGKRIVLGVGVDENKDGVWDRSEKCQGGIYDIASGKLAMLDIPDELVLPMFDDTDKGLVVVSVGDSGKKTKLYTTPLDKIALKEMDVVGLCAAGNPWASMIPVIVREQGESRRPKYKLKMHDLSSNKALADLAIDENMPLGTSGSGMIWTSDGRYFCYADVSMTGADVMSAKGISRIWDSKEQKEVAKVELAIPAGPGPISTAVLLVAEGFPGAASKRAECFQVYDIATGKTYKVGEASTRLITTNGKKVVCLKTADGGSTVTISDLKMTAE